MKRQGAWKYSKTKITMRSSDKFHENNPFPSKLNIMSDEDKKARGIDDSQRPSAPIWPDKKFET